MFLKRFELAKSSTNCGMLVCHDEIGGSIDPSSAASDKRFNIGRIPLWHDPIKKID